jgi:hypothetical protein
MKFYKGNFGLIYKVYKTEGGSWAWVDSCGCGFINENKDYVIEYLKETKGNLTWIEL